MPLAPPPTAPPPELVFAGKHMRSESVRSHAHDCPELIFIVEGHCQVDMDNGQLHASPGDMLVIPEHCAHNQISDGYIHTLYAGFHTFLHEQVTGHIVHLDDVVMIEACMNLLADAHMHRCAASREACSALLQAVLVELEAVQNSRNSRSNATPSRLRTALRYVEDNLDEVISIDDLADHLSMSASNLYLMFRTHMDTTPMHYVMKERMKRARRYLSDPYLTVKEVAGRCGYKDTNLFVRTFKKVHGQPPGQWRSANALNTIDTDT